MTILNDTYESKTEYRRQIRLQLKRNKQHLESLDYKGTRVKNEFQLDCSFYPKPNPNCKIMYFDVDNTLYSKSTGIEKAMLQLIYNYLIVELDLSYKQAIELVHVYNEKYGMVLSGLIKNFNINIKQFNEMCDDALPLQHFIEGPDLKLRKMLIDLKQTTKIDKFWIFTNSYKNHALRCIKILGIADLFDGITYCDYFANDFMCKPSPAFFDKLRLESGLADWNNALFIDDNINNIEAASYIGMKVCFHIAEKDKFDHSRNEDDTKKLERSSKYGKIIPINDILELPLFASDAC
ncbi:hypothetical protein KAFR_0B01490 [Kazachstania africana CBS 2517]|uniref:Pyrimidine 5'-nucleotidase n=1 Tax=Kazachstania africana (strain ATCC 22294 / BCRC 22015 / CBS 2517 / CECT 1963 / NBRC 1671 / NRRL Y-8276) TaxID=1071382 RepID=H2APZ8_KAZAF|nr:hypothetical protein KAFR_0B01490 [Kazachstania africana CBS 2517]CCF56448.1 hypothetical protein KAFR_0B01490 [Kazachstania africana CBS 2517]